MGQTKISKKRGGAAASNVTTQLVIIKELETSISAGNVKDYNGIMELLGHLRLLETGQVRSVGSVLV